MPTPHNRAENGQIAKTVLMPGDPRRAEMIAKTFLEDVSLVSDVRGMFCFTGTVEGKPVSVMGSGMGVPSIGIYSYELYTQYGVENIIRVGSAGASAPALKLFDVVLADRAWSESSFARTMSGFTGDSTYPSEALNKKLAESAARLGIPITLGAIHSSDVFYREPWQGENYWRNIRDEHGCVCVEMESFALFHNAKVTGKNAACLLTISDNFNDSAVTTAEEREKGFTEMMKIALGVV
ncbi:MAG: purine-nucleoside phosphorylase [Firmicutes bacterium]|nr:purine-nucleoside phosphorylase [Bacillota bacterium]